MPRPQFTADEEYLIQSARSPMAGSDGGAFMWGYVGGGLGLAAFAVYSGSVVLLGSAFLVVCGFRIYEERHQKQWTPLWRSIINKYEWAVEDGPSGK
jgi:hypothetical protein